MRDLTGYLLKKKRLELGLQQKQLCKGICSTSYLCKIECGDAAPGDDVLRLLFERLGVADWHGCEGTEADRAMLRQYFTAVLNDQPAQTLADAVSSRLNALEGSQLALYVPLFRAYECIRTRAGDGLSAAIKLIGPFLPWLSPPQEVLYAHVCVYHDPTMPDVEKLVQRAEQRYPCSISALDGATVSFAQGQYHQALIHIRTGFDRAVKEGCVPQMAAAARLETNCYANLGELTLMRSAAERAMGFYSGNAAEQANIAYNIGATLLEFGHDREALDYLLRAYAVEPVWPWEKGMICHKLSLLLPKLHRQEEAARYLKEAQEILSASCDPLTSLMLEIASLRLDKHYLDDPAYATALRAFCRDAVGQLPHGYVQFHERMLEELLVHERRYKDAYLLVKRRESSRNAIHEV